MRFLKIEDKIGFASKKYDLGRKIEDIFMEYGFRYLEPSIFEDYDDFVSQNKRIKSSNTIKVLNSDGNILILRPDITTNIIKNIIPRWEEDSEVEIFYNSKIFKSFENRIMEIRQVGIEMLGLEKNLGDKKSLILSLDILSSFQDDFILELGSTRFIQSLIAGLNLDEKDEIKLKRIIYRKNAFELKEFLSQIDSSLEYKDVLMKIFDLQGNLIEIFNKAKDICINKEMKESLEEIKEIIDALKEDINFENIQLDLSMISELDYYDGIIFKGFYKNNSNEILSGGRYDPLTKRLGKEISSIGFSIDLDQMMKSLYKRGDI